MADRRRAPDPDLALAAEGYITDTRAELIEDAIARALDVPATTVEPEWRALIRSYALTRASAPDVGSPR